MTTELLKPGYSNVSCNEDQCAFSGAVGCPLSWKFQLREKDSVSEKTTITFLTFFNLFLTEKGNFYLNTKGAFHTI